MGVPAPIRDHQRSVPAAFSRKPETLAYFASRSHNPIAAATMLKVKIGQTNHHVADGLFTACLGMKMKTSQPMPMTHVWTNGLGSGNFGQRSAAMPSARATTAAAVQAAISV